MSKGGFIPKLQHRIGVAVTAVLFLAGAFLIYRRAALSGFDFGQFLETFGRGRPSWLLLATLLTVLSYVVRALRWQVMLRPVKRKPSLWNVLQATAVGYLAVIVFGRAGEVVRPYLISKREGVPLASQLAAWLLERIYDLLAVILMFGYGLVLLRGDQELQRSGLIHSLNMGGWIVALLGTVCLLVLVGVHIYSDRLEDRITTALSFLQQHHQERVAGAVRSTLAGLRSTHSLGSVVRLIAYTLLEWSFLLGVFLCVFSAFPETSGLDIPRTLILMCITSLGGIVQIPAIGGGPQIAAALALTELFRLPLEPASGIALMLWAINIVAILPFGVVFGFHLGFSWRSIRQVEQETAL